MLSQEEYVVLSLELHLFFLRIMKEHALFLEAAFTPKNSDLAKLADNYKMNLEGLLQKAVSISNGVIRPNVMASGEIITDFTLGVEQKTQNFTGIPINTDITSMESRLHSGPRAQITPQMVTTVRSINREAMRLVEGLIDFKERILHSVLSCTMFTLNYPLLIEHILREAKLYRGFIQDLERGGNIDNRDMRQTELFWDQIMLEHALFIRGLLDPTEDELVETANDFADEYADLLKMARQATDATLVSVTDKTLKETIKYRDFKKAGTQGIAECKIRSVILPLLGDHVLREANHYIRLLKME